MRVPRRRPAEPADEILVILTKRLGNREIQIHRPCRRLVATVGEVPLLARQGCQAFIERSQAFPVLRASAINDVVVIRSGNYPEGLRFCRSVEQRLAELYWDCVVSPAVNKKDRRPNSDDLPTRIETPDEQWTDHRQNGSRYIAGGSEGCFQDDAATLVPGCKVNSHCRAQRLTVHYDLLRLAGLQKVIGVSNGDCREEYSRTFVLAGPPYLAAGFVRPCTSSQ